MEPLRVINDEWNVNFYSDIKVIQAEQGECQDIAVTDMSHVGGKWVDLFQFPWYGLRETWYKEGKTYQNRCYGEGQDRKCDVKYTKPFPMVQATIIQGRRICAL